MNEKTIQQLPIGASIIVTIYDIGEQAPESATGWKLYDNFSNYGILEASSSDELQEAARNLAIDIVAQHDGISKQMENGTAVFDELKKGIYLGIVDNEKADITFNPFIITIPMVYPETHALTYDCSVILKDS